MDSVAETKAGVDLGFFDGDFPAWNQTRDHEDWELESRHFPSKLGGKPAWLDLKNLPKSETLQCGKCGRTRKFLLQIYSPDDKEDSAFHRTLYVFICTEKSCWAQRSDCPVLVLRSQLGRDNPFYPTSPPEEDKHWRTDIRAEKYGPLCPVCGCGGAKMCGRCRGVSYCGEDHQRRDWRRGHKQECKEGGMYGGPHTGLDALLQPQGLIDIEEEPQQDTEQAVEEKYRELVEGGGEAGDLEPGTSPADWEELEENQTEDKASYRFKMRISRAPRQILRYSRGGEGPLLCSYTHQLNAQTNCSICGSQRTFEFQVMPQVLSLLGLGSDLDGGVDWGSLYIFTCSKSCPVVGYEEEFATILHFDPTLPPVPGN